MRRKMQSACIFRRKAIGKSFQARQKLSGGLDGVVAFEFMDIAPIMALLVIAVNMAFATPAACPNIAMAFALKDWCRPTDLYKYGSLMVVFSLIFLFVIVLPWANVVY